MPRALPHQNNRYYQTSIRKKNYTQNVSFILGCALIVIGLAGILNPGFIGMHLSLMHIFVLMGSGTLAIWGATNTDPLKSYRVDLGLGLFFALHAIAGFILGEPGVPRVGWEGRDELLIKIAPGFLELGTVDHFVHALLTLFFLSGAWSWRHKLKRAHRLHNEKNG